MADIYTKAVLTVIALALIVIAGRDLLRPATAQSPMHVILDDIDRGAFQQVYYSTYPLAVYVKPQ
jgi:hypothetical protein